MKEVKKTILNAGCSKCSKQQLLLETNFPIMKEHLEYFIKNNYKDIKSYSNSGIFYIEDANLIAIAPFGTNRIQIKCKNSNCSASLDILEDLIKNIE